MFVSIMSEQKVVSLDETDEEMQTEIVKEIKKNIASLKTSIDQIIHDMEYIRATKLEILEKLDNVKNENAMDSTQIQVTLGKARKIMRKSEDNRRKLELVLGKINEFNVLHTFNNFTEALGTVDDIPDIIKSGKEKFDKDTRIVPGQERIKLRLLENNKYSLTTIENKEEKEKYNLKWGRDSALRELRWLVKMKLYKLRHRYDKLTFEQEVEERTPLPVKWRIVSGERA